MTRNRLIWGVSMKRIACMAFLLVLMVNTLFASIVGDALGSIVGSSLDMAASDYATVVQIDGQEIGFGGKGIASLKHTFKQHDFSQVSYQQRQEIYGKAQISLGWPAWKNLLVGFGKGSKLQGDFGGMLFGQISDWTTLSIAGAGMGIILLDILFVQIFSASNDSMQLNNPDDPFNQLGIAAMAIGGGAFAVGRLIQALIPLTFGARYNKALRKGLLLDKNLSDTLGLDVALVPVSGSLAIRWVGKVSLNPRT